MRLLKQGLPIQSQHRYVQPWGGQQEGSEYESANGARILNEADKGFNAFTEDGREKQMVVQMCEVILGLLSVSKVARAGNRSVFANGNSYIENKNSGPRTRLQGKGGVLTLNMSVRRSFC